MNDPMGMPHSLVEHDRVDHLLVRAAKGMAMLGGAGFLALVALSVVSIVKRKIGFGSVEGDIELMQLGTAVFAAAFLPYCSLLGEHLKVEFFTESASPRLKRLLDGVADFALAGVFAVLVWRTTLYTLNLREAGEVTPLVGFPIWIAVALVVPSLVLAFACAAYRVGYAAFGTSPAGETR